MIPNRILIQFTGAQGTGKTTLVRALKEKLMADQFYIPETIEKSGETYTYEYGTFPLLDIPIIGEVSRSLLDKQIISKIDTNATAVEQMYINAELMERYFKILGMGYNLILAERTPICCMGYAANIPGIDEYTYKFTQRFIHDIQDRKDINILTFYVAPLETFEEDGVRTYASQAKVDGTVRAVLEDYQIPYTLIPPKSLDERLDLVIDVIKIFAKEHRYGR
jgi:nicotinamide riboside kinase